jgi:hypothetical protein
MKLSRDFNRRPGAITRRPKTRVATALAWSSECRSARPNLAAGGWPFTQSLRKDGAKTILLHPPNGGGWFGEMAYNMSHQKISLQIQ